MLILVLMKNVLLLSIWNTVVLIHMYLFFHDYLINRSSKEQHLFKKIIIFKTSLFCHSVLNGNVYDICLNLVLTHCAY